MAFEWKFSLYLHYQNCMIMVDKRVIEQVLAEQYVANT